MENNAPFFLANANLNSTFRIPSGDKRLSIRIGREAELKSLLGKMLISKGISIGKRLHLIWLKLDSGELLGGTPLTMQSQ